MENYSLKQLSELTASSAPVPGGGGISGTVSSLSASLSMMVTNLTIGKAKYLEYTDELETLKQELNEIRISLLNSLNKDAKAFEPLAKAYSMDKNTTGYTETLEECLRKAANSPFEILKETCKIIDIDERLAVIGSKISVSDAATSVMLASGALYGSYINILVNTRLMKDKEYADKLNKEAKAYLDEYSKKAIIIFDDITRRLNG